MKKVIAIFGAAMLTAMCLQNAVAASGKCKIVQIEGKRMVIECEKIPKGFSENGKIKIKTQKNGSIEGC